MEARFKGWIANRHASRRIFVLADEQRDKIYAIQARHQA
jgi:hypothetical protein